MGVLAMVLLEKVEDVQEKDVETKVVAKESRKARARAKVEKIGERKEKPKARWTLSSAGFVLSTVIGAVNVQIECR